MLFETLNFYDVVILSGVEAITDLYVTLPGDVTTIPQKYTVHCVINEKCGCISRGSAIVYDMFMEGSLDEPAVQFCAEEPTLSCSKGSNSHDTPLVDKQLIVTWNAETVIEVGDYSIISTVANGDHDFACLANYSRQLFGGKTAEKTFISVRGACFSYACA